METFNCCKLEIFIPESHLGKLQDTLQSADAARVNDTVKAIKGVHLYEEPVINVIPLYMTGMD